MGDEDDDGDEEEEKEGRSATHTHSLPSGYNQQCSIITIFLCREKNN